jgi:hypothetical protein
MIVIVRWKPDSDGDDPWLNVELEDPDGKKWKQISRDRVSLNPDDFPRGDAYKFKRAD